MSMQGDSDAVATAAAVESVMEPASMEETVAAAMDDSTQEPSLKKARNSLGSVTSPRERNKYKGMRIRQCLCGKPECLPRLKGWIDLGDGKRQGFKELPRQSSKTTPVGLEKNHIRDIMFLHVRGHKAPRYEESDKTNRERKLFVAFHHFHPLVLQDGNKGPMQYVYLELAERIGGFHEHDAVQNLPGIVFHPIPNYPKELADKDFEACGGIEQERYARPRKNMAPQKATPKKDMRTRVREVLGQMEHDPLKVANEYLEMQEQLRARTAADGEEEEMEAHLKQDYHTVQNHDMDEGKFGAGVVDV